MKTHTTGEPKLATVRVRRHDPSTGAGPVYEEFEGVPFEDRSVLDVLHSIYLERDPSLGYPHVCSKGFCGSCMLVVNGLPVLACQYPAQAEMTVEPHPRFPVVRDLVVDVTRREAGDPKGTALAAGAATAPGANGSQGADGPRARIDPDKCVHCRDCIAVCPAGVYGFVNKRVQAVDRWSCLGPSCNMCVDTCWKMAISMEQPETGSPAQTSAE